MKRFGKMMLRAGLAAMALGMAGSAQAAILLFSSVSPGQVITWQMDSNPASLPGVITSSTDAFIIPSYPITVNGVAVNAYITYFSSSFSGGFFLGHAGTFSEILRARGREIFTGGSINPTFAPGTFNLTSDGGAVTLTILPQVTSGAVPEPATWVMMLAGFGLVGGALRRGQAGRVRVTKVGYSG
jgi:hypothetical protein